MAKSKSQLKREAVMEEAKVKEEEVELSPIAEGPLLPEEETPVVEEPVAQEEEKVEEEAPKEEFSIPTGKIRLEFRKPVEIFINGTPYIGTVIDAPNMVTASEIVRLAKDAYGWDVLK